jgi:hypothetical protein
MLVYAVNRYTNSELICQKRGVVEDIVDVFCAYYRSIRSERKLKEMRVVRNTQLFHEVLTVNIQCDFLRINMAYMLGNIRDSLSAIFERQKNNVCRILKIDSRISP